jgi:tripeptidyl-peptidase-1
MKRIALDVSDPDSPRYGQYLQQDLIDRLTAPDVAATAAIRQWLGAAAGAHVHETKGRYFTVECSTADAEALLSTSFRWVENQATTQTVLRASDFTIPDALEHAVHAVFGLHGLPLAPRKFAEVQGFPPAPRNATPATIASTYKIGGVTVSRSETNRQAVAAFLGMASYNQTDINTFFEKYVPDAQPGDSLVSKMINNTGHVSDILGEGELDTQYIMGVAPGIKTEFWLFGNSTSFCQNIKEWTLAILADDSGPLVHSASYGYQGPLLKVACHPDEISAVDADLVKIAAKGVTLIWCSQDDGSGYGVAGNTSQLWPSWPAGSPWVTAVGSTTFVDATPGSEEMATDVFGSGGGFSSRFDRSDAQWQSEAVEEYLRIVPKGPPFPPSSLFSPQGRGTPDVSALGWGYPIYVNGRVTVTGGTSASTPVFAGVVSLLNEARLQRGMKPLGFLNPWLYKHADAFTDVTKGTNAIGRFTSKPLKYGFNCTVGWDAATGLGTPKFDKLLAAATKDRSEIVV